MTLPASGLACARECKIYKVKMAATSQYGASCQTCLLPLRPHLRHATRPGKPFFHQDLFWHSPFPFLFTHHGDKRPAKWSKVVGLGGVFFEVSTHSLATDTMNQIIENDGASSLLMQIQRTKTLYPASGPFCPFNFRCVCPFPYNLQTMPAK